MRASERVLPPHPRSFFHPRPGREKGERFITAFIARRVLARAGWIGLWRLLNFDVTKSLFRSLSPALLSALSPLVCERARKRIPKRDPGGKEEGSFHGTRLILLEFKFYRAALSARSVNHKPPYICEEQSAAVGSRNYKSRPIARMRMSMK